MVEVKKQDRETTQALVRRFTSRVKKSGILVRARDIRFRKRLKSEQMKKRAALRRQKLREEYQKMEKLGRIK
jgi:hypothetical protein